MSELEFLLFENRSRVLSALKGVADEIEKEVFQRVI
jgi:hypothetical protein